MLSIEKILELYEGGLTTREVAREMGCGKSYVQTVVSRAGKSREKRPRKCIYEQRVKHFDLSVSKSYLDGLLISDGSLTNPKSYCLSCGYAHSSISKSWLETIANDFRSFGITSRITPDLRPTKCCHVLLTKHYSEFSHLWSAWYGSGYKRVPHDIKWNDEQFLKNWIYGDGTLVNGTQLRFCCESFHEQIDWMIDRLTQSLGYKFGKVFMGYDVCGNKKFRITLNVSGGLVEFYHRLGKPLDCFSYKWRLS